MKRRVLRLAILRVKARWVKRSLALVGGPMTRKMARNARRFNRCSLARRVVPLARRSIVAVLRYIFAMNILVVPRVRRLAVGRKWVKYWWILIRRVRRRKTPVPITCAIILLPNRIKARGRHVTY